MNVHELEKLLADAEQSWTRALEHHGRFQEYSTWCIGEQVAELETISTRLERRLSRIENNGQEKPQ